MRRRKITGERRGLRRRLDADADVDADADADAVVLVVPVPAPDIVSADYANRDASTAPRMNRSDIDNFSLQTSPDPTTTTSEVES